jgi:hypothetical protein
MPSTRRSLARVGASAFVVVCFSFGAVTAFGHHSYAMFDTSKSVVVHGSVAKIDWVNPHTFVWLYVEKKDQPGRYDLYGFENGPINMLARGGWTKDVLAVGEKVRVQYFPLKDGRPGGSFIKAIREDGTELIGDPFAPGVERAAKSTPPEQ